MIPNREGRVASARQGGLAFAFRTGPSPLREAPPDGGAPAPSPADYFGTIQLSWASTPSISQVQRMFLYVKLTSSMWV